jgi:hypothetical protein
MTDYSSAGICEGVSTSQGAGHEATSSLGVPSGGAADYSYWSGHFGASSGSGAGASIAPGVPETASVILMAWALIAIFSVGRQSGLRLNRSR